jgi:hypothetical protein
VTPRHLALLAIALPVLACRPEAAERAAAEPGADSAVVPVGVDSAVVLARGFLGGGPYAADYLLDSVRVLATDSSWQVFVKRVDWERRRPGEALVEVSRATGRTRQVPLK